jgi:hypothetical protein
MTRHMQLTAGLMLLLIGAATASTASAQEPGTEAATDGALEASSGSSGEGAPTGESNAEVKADVALSDAVAPKKDEKKWKSPWRGTSITYRNAVTALTFKKDADLTYNPYYEMSWTFHPQWWVGNVFNAALDFTITRELTEADDTTFDNETLFSDVTLVLAASKFVTIPVLKIDLSASLSLIGPTSKAAQARTMLFGMKPGLSLKRNFDVLAGINLGYSFGISKFFYEATTAQNEEAAISGCAASPGGCEAYQNTGLRNASWGLSNSFSLSIAFIDQLSLDASFGLKHSFLYAQSDNVSNEQMSDWQPGDNNDIRYSMLYGLGVTVTPIQALSIGLGAETMNPQLKADATYQRPFFNRYTVVYLDLTLDVDGLVQQLTSNED